MESCEVSLPRAKLLYEDWEEEDTAELRRVLRLVSKPEFGWYFSWEQVA